MVAQSAQLHLRVRMRETTRLYASTNSLIDHFIVTSLDLEVELNNIFVRLPIHTLNCYLVAIELSC